MFRNGKTAIDGGSRLETAAAEAGGQCFVRAECRGEPIPSAGNGGYRLRSEDLAQGADLHLKVVLLHHQPGPDQLKQLLLGDQALAPLDQGEQNVQRPRPQRYRQPFSEQLTGGRIELEPAEAVCEVHPRKSTPMAAVSEGFSHASAA